MVKFVVQLSLGILSTITFGIRGLFRRCKSQKESQDDEEKKAQVPRVSVIVPAYNEEGTFCREQHGIVVLFG